jgi:hypothetical protein
VREHAHVRHDSKPGGQPRRAGLGHDRLLAEHHRARARSGYGAVAGQHLGERGIEPGAGQLIEQPSGRATRQHDQTGLGQQRPGCVQPTGLGPDVWNGADLVGTEFAIPAHPIGSGGAKLEAGLHR